MWERLPDSEKNEYKKMILAFSSLSEMFQQKKEDDDEISPFINSKYQETVFQKAFNATAEDIGNTSYDVSICKIDEQDNELKYLVGIKTFIIDSGDQKVAQFKANHNEWSSIIEQIEKNARGKNNQYLKKSEIDNKNKALYKELANKIAELRNLRIQSSEANLQGFSISDTTNNVYAVYHVLMPSKKGAPPCIFVGETSYDKIDIDKIEIKGCTKRTNPTNFFFTDGKHDYKYTSADSQLYMNFHNKDIVIEKWDVAYADDAYSFFSELADKLYPESNEYVSMFDYISSYQKVAEDSSLEKYGKRESYSWLLENNKGEVELFSGFNGFYGVGSKLPKNVRKAKINAFKEEYQDEVRKQDLHIITNGLREFLLKDARTADEKINKVFLRDSILEKASQTNNKKLNEDICKLLFRPKSEMYIPIPNAKKFHDDHTDFFGVGLGALERINKQWKSPLTKEQRRFTLVFDPSGEEVDAFLTQDSLKGIESVDSQSILGDWILRKVFQLKDYEPLTKKRLNEIGINGIRLEKDSIKNKIHLSFIWIDKDNLPSDYVLD